MLRSCISLRESISICFPDEPYNPNRRWIKPRCSPIPPPEHAKGAHDFDPFLFQRTPDTGPRKTRESLAINSLILAPKPLKSGDPRRWLKLMGVCRSNNLVKGATHKLWHRGFAGLQADFSGSCTRFHALV